MKKEIVQRIERQLGLPGLADRLAEELEPTDLQSLMMAVYRKRSERRSPADLLRDFEQNRFVGPANLSSGVANAWEQAAWETLPAGFEQMTLAPVAPLGCSAAMAGVDQDWAVATVRNTEVVSDPTNVMALACAKKRRTLLRENPKSSEPVHLATHQRVLRPQFYDAPGMLAHFCQFALCSASRDRGNRLFETEAIATHIVFYIEAVRRFLGETIPIRITLTDFAGDQNRDRLEQALFHPLRQQIEASTCRFDQKRTGGRDYYRDLCFKLEVIAGDGSVIEIGDGGSVDWTQKLLSNKKERLIISGVGSERICGLLNQPC